MVPRIGGLRTGLGVVHQPRKSPSRWLLDVGHADNHEIVIDDQRLADTAPVRLATGWLRRGGFIERTAGVSILAQTFS